MSDYFCQMVRSRHSKAMPVNAETVWRLYKEYVVNAWRECIENLAAEQLAQSGSMPATSV